MQLGVLPTHGQQALSDVWVLILRGTEVPGSSDGVRGFLTSIVACLDAEGDATALLEKLRRVSSSSESTGKATLVTIEGGGVGGGLLEAKPRDALAAIKLFLHKCL